MVDFWSGVWYNVIMFEILASRGGETGTVDYTTPGGDVLAGSLEDLGLDYAPAPDIYDTIVSPEEDLPYYSLAQLKRFAVMIDNEIEKADLSRKTVTPEDVVAGYAKPEEILGYYYRVHLDSSL